MSTPRHVKQTRTVIDMAKQQEPVEVVKPKYSKNMRFPVDVAIPVQVAIVSGLQGTRRLRINGAADAVPVPVVEWLQNDSRYAGWFSETLPKKSLVELAADAPKRRQTVKATVKGADEPEASAEVEDDGLRPAAES